LISYWLHSMGTVGHGCCAVGLCEERGENRSEEREGKAESISNWNLCLVMGEGAWLVIYHPLVGVWSDIWFCGFSTWWRIWRCGGIWWDS